MKSSVMTVSMIVIAGGLSVAIAADATHVKDSIPDPASAPYASIYDTAPSGGVAAQGPKTKIHRMLARRLDSMPGDQTIKAWVLFRDKGVTSVGAFEASIDTVASSYNRRAIERRRLRRSLPGLFDEHDLPVSRRYIDEVAAAGAAVGVVSKWVNGVSVRGSKGQLETIGKMPFVKIVQPVRRGGRTKPAVSDVPKVDPAARTASNAAGTSGFYGEAEEQLTQLNLIALHDLGYTGNGVIIGVLDTGFNTTHNAFNDATLSLNVIAEYDFVDDDPDPRGHPGHGTGVLGTISAYMPNELVGGAYEASVILCRTEDVYGEYPAEEDYYVAGLEFVEANGGDMATASLCYYDFWPEFSYTQEDMNGLTAVTTIGVNVATGNGMHCQNGACNEGHDDDPNVSHLAAPADAFKVFSTGAVDYTGAIASFSSDGPTADGRTKPELLARGIDVRTVDPNDDTAYVGAAGTSFSGPLAAAVIACLIEAHPEWTVDQMRNYLFRNGVYFVANGTFDPLYIRGYGIIDAAAALAGDCNGNGVDDATDIAGPTSGDCDGNGLPDECEFVLPGEARDCNDTGIIDACEISSGTSPDCDSNGVPDECDADCNEDGTPDTCETDAGLKDCDDDGVCNGVEIAECPAGQPTCDDCNDNSVPDECDIASGTSSDIDENGVPDECIHAPALPPPPHDRAKNRFISFTPDYTLSVALRVEMLDLACSVTGRRCLTNDDCQFCIGGTEDSKPCDGPADCPDGGTCPVGETCDEQGPPIMLGWVSQPSEAGNDAPTGTLTAQVVSDPVVRTWAEEVVHLGDCEIAPVHAYLLSATADPDGGVFSAPLIIDTIARPEGKFWADVVGSYSGSEWTGPNGLVNVDDAMAFINFKLFKPAPHITAIELAGSPPSFINFYINVTDLGLIMQGFRGLPYPPLPFVLDGYPADMDLTACP